MATKKKQDPLDCCEEFTQCCEDGKWADCFALLGDVHDLATAPPPKGAVKDGEGKEDQDARLADCEERLAACAPNGKAKAKPAVGADPKQLDPATVALLIQLGQKLFELIRRRWFTKADPE